MQMLFDFDTAQRRPRIISPCLAEIREIFSVEDKAAVFIRRRLGKHIPVRKYAITPTGYFDLPFYDTIYNTVKRKFPSVEITATKAFNTVAATQPIAEEPLELSLKPRDYQYQATQTALQNGKGIIVLPTSAGKTLVLAIISHTCFSLHNHRVLILVPNLQLVHQTYKEFVDVGISSKNVSIWTGSNEYQHTPIVIANNQILLSKTTNTSILDTFDVLLADECHKFASATKIIKLVKTMKIKHMFGLTGSLPESEYDVWSLNRIFGEIIYFKKSEELRKQKFISKVRVVALEIEYKFIPDFTKASMADPTAGFVEELEWLQTNEFRNTIISKLTDKLQTNTLVLVDRIAHGEHLLKWLKETTSKQVYFVRGSIEVEEREQIRKLMEKSNDVICIAVSKIFATGISIKNLHNVIFASIGKARIKIIQSIGRSLRLHHTKKMATIFDIADVSLIYGARHFAERKNLYESEKIPLITQTVVEK